MTNTQSLSGRKRANGAKSDSPVSAEAKARSAGNTLKHGLLSPSMTLPTEHPAFFDDLNRDITLELRPTSITQAILARSFAMCALRLNRIWDLEAAAQREEIASLPESSGVHGTLEAWRRLHSNDPSFASLRRYEITFTREMHRSLRHLHELQEQDAERNEPTEDLTPALSTPPEPPQVPPESLPPATQAEPVAPKSPLKPLFLIFTLLTLAQAASALLPFRHFSFGDSRAQLSAAPASPPTAQAVSAHTD